MEDALSPSGGLGVHMDELTRKLAKDVDITLFCVGDGEEGFSESRNRRVMRIVNQNDFWMGSPTSAYVDLVTLDQFLLNAVQAFSNERFDVIHLHDSHLWRVARTLAELWDAKIVYTVHLAHTLVHDFIATDSWAYAATNEMSAAYESDAVISVSNAYRAEFANQVMLSTDRIDVIPNGVDSQFLNSIPFDIAIREKYGTPRRKLAVFVGRLVSSKGVELVTSLAAQRPDWDFVAVASIAPTIEKYARELPRRFRAAEQALDNFTWLNRLDQPTKWLLMKAADIGLVPSIHEPFGIVALEWMALETPLMTTGVGGLADFVNTSNAVVVEYDVEAWSRALTKFKRSERRIEQGLVTAQSYTWSSAADDTMKVYEKVMNHDRQFRQPRIVMATGRT